MQPSHLFVVKFFRLYFLKVKRLITHLCHSGQVTLLGGFCLTGSVWLQCPLVISSFLMKNLGQLLPFFLLVSCLFSKTLSQDMTGAVVCTGNDVFHYQAFPSIFIMRAHHCCNNTGPHYSYHAASLLLSKDQGGFKSDYDFLFVCLLAEWQGSIIQSKHF